MSNTNGKTNSRTLKPNAKCTGRMHIFSDDQRAEFAKSEDQWILSKCPSCEKSLWICTRCAGETHDKGGKVKYRYKQYMFQDRKGHDNSESYHTGFERANQFTRLRKSGRNTETSLLRISVPRVTSKSVSTPFSGSEGAQVFPQFIPGISMSMPIDASNLIETYFNRGNNPGTSDDTYAEEGPNPLRLDQGEFVNAINGHGNDILEKIKCLAEHGIVTAADKLKPYHLFVTRKHSTIQWVAPHTDLHPVLLIVLRGAKCVYVGANPEATGQRNSFLDLANHEWTKQRTESSHTVSWHPVNKAMVSPTDVQEAQCFKRHPLCPGDALFIPKRFLHAVETLPDTVMMSITIQT